MRISDWSSDVCSSDLEGRDALTADIRAALSQSGALTGPAVTVQSLANKGLTRAEARDPLSYDKGDLVRFTRDYSAKDVTRGKAYRVENVDPARSAITLQSERSAAHTSELQSLMRLPYDAFCL